MKSSPPEEQQLICVLTITEQKIIAGDCRQPMSKKQSCEKGSVINTKIS